MTARFPHQCVFSGLLGVLLMSGSMVSSAQSDGPPITFKSSSGAFVAIDETVTFYCFDRERRLTPLQIRPVVARNAPARQINLGPRASVEFKFSPPPACDDHLVLSVRGFDPATLISNALES